MLVKYYYKKKYLTVLAFLVDLICLLIKLFSLGFMMRKRKLISAPRKILIMRLDHLGDVLYTLPSLPAIKKKYPESKITYLAGSWAETLLQDNPYVDEILVYRAPWFDRSQKKKWDLRTFLKLVKELRDKRFDVSIDFKGYFPHIILMSLANISFKLSHGDVGGKFLLDFEVARDRNKHILFQNEDFLKAIGVSYAQMDFDLWPSDQDRRCVESLLEENHIDSAERVAVFHCGAGVPIKFWEVNKFQELIRKVREMDFTVILVGTDADKSRNEEIIKGASDKIINLAGRTTIRQLIVLFTKAKLFVGSDSFPAHLAAIANVPTVCIFSMVNSPTEWSPWGKNVELVYKDVPCKGCEKKTSCESMECLRSITVDDVYEKVKEVLKK